MSTFTGGLVSGIDTGAMISSLVAAAAKPLDAAALLARVRSALAAATAGGALGLRALAAGLRARDVHGSGTVLAASAQAELAAHGAPLSRDCWDLLLRGLPEAIVDEEGGCAGGVTPRRRLRPLAEATLRIDGLLAALRGGTYTAGRRALVQRALDHLLAQKAVGKLPRYSYLAGVPGELLVPASAPTAAQAPALAPEQLTVSEVKAAYDARFDARVAAGLRTPVEVALEFARAWPQHPVASAPVTSADFHALHADMAAVVADDADFAARVHNAWHLAGGGRWKTKASKICLVTTFKGSSQTVTLPEAEDIADDDGPALIAALRQLGVGGVARVKVLRTEEVE